MADTNDAVNVTQARRRRTPARPPVFPVTVSRLPVVRCGVCARPMAHRPGEAGEMLTRHYAEAGHAL